MLDTLINFVRCLRGLHEGKWVKKNQPTFKYFFQYEQTCVHCNTKTIIKDDFLKYEVTTTGELHERKN